MRTLLVLSVLMVIPASQVSAQPSHLFTHSSIPSAEALDRISLQLAWYKKVPTLGLKDGIATIQLIPGEDGEELLLQTKGGLVQLMDPENGDLKWRSPVGLPNRHFHGPGFNSHSIYVTRDTRLFALNRKSGEHRLFVIGKSGVPDPGVPISNPPSTALIADEVAVFIPADIRLVGYLMPKPSDLAVNLPPVFSPQLMALKKLESSPEPKFQATYSEPGINFSKPLGMAKEVMCGFANNGTFVSINKFSLAERSRYKTYGISLAGFGQYGEMAYVGSADFTMYAFHMGSLKVNWRFLSGSPIVRTPMPTENDVFVTNTKSGLCRVNRENGNFFWKNAEADQFLSVNEKFVYALDAKRNLLVLDYLKGTTLSRYNTSDFLVPYSNTFTDRIYLANHDGVVMCLHNTKYQKPYRPSPNAIPSEL